jgi:hypothetical protein
MAKITPQTMQFNSGRIISLAEEDQGNESYVSIKLVLLDTLVNLNKIQYSAEFIQDIVDRKQDFMAIPLMAETSKLEKGKYDNLTHAYNPKTGQFKSQMIGSFVDFTTNMNGEVLELLGECRVPKRFEQTTIALQELFDESLLQFSYEISVGEYTSTDGIKFVDKSPKNSIFAMAVVSNPAVISSKALTLCAAMDEDFNINLGNGGMDMQRNKENFTVEEMFKNAKVTLVAELDMNQIQRKIYNALQSFIEENYYEYDVVDQSMTYIIVKKWNDGEFYKIDYTVSETDVALSNMRKVSKKYEDIPEEEDIVTIAELQAEVETLKAEAITLNATIETNKVEMAEVLATKETELAEVNSKLTILSESIIAKDVEIAELAPMKIACELAEATKIETELAEKKTALKEKFSKLLSAEVIAEVEIAEALENLNEVLLNSRVVEIAMATAIKVPDVKSTITLASRIVDNLKLSGSEPGTLREKYSI